MLSLNTLHQRIYRADIHTPQASLAVVIIKSLIYHCLFPSILPLLKPEHHVRTCGVTEAAVDTSVLDKQRDIAFS